MIDDIQLIEILYKVTSDLPDPGRNSEADNTSSYSDLTKWRIHPEFLKSGRTAYLSCLTIVFLGLNPIQEHDLKKQLLIIADKRAIQGYWKNVSEILQLPFTPMAFYQYHFEQFPSKHEFFGNDLKTMKYIWRSLKANNPYKPSTARVKYPQRKRGYDDKGHLSGDSHGADIALPPREKFVETEEVNIQAQLWLSEVYKVDNKQQGTLGENTTSQKEAHYEKQTNRTSNRDDRRENGEATKATRFSEIFNWRRPSDQNEILNSFFYMVVKNRKEKLWFRPQFFFYYIRLVHGKEKSKVYGKVPRIFLEKEQKILSAKVPNHKSLNQFTIEEIFAMFP